MTNPEMQGVRWYVGARAINGYAGQKVVCRLVMVLVMVLMMFWQREEDGDGWENELLLWGRPLLPFGYFG